MRKDIENPIVDEIAIAVVKDKGEDNEEVWMSYLINLKSQKINNVIISTKGYGQKEGKKVQTSVLRHYFEEIDARSVTKIEPIMPNLIGLFNEFWLSFYIGRTIYDKKYIFVAESISDKNCIKIPILNKKGVMIK